MKPAQPKPDSKFITLRQAAEKLGVTVETLLDWNDSNILKPIISQDGVIGYKKQQIDKFLSVQQLFQKNNKTQTTTSSTSDRNISPDIKVNNLHSAPSQTEQQNVDMYRNFKTGNISAETKVKIDSDIDRAKLIGIGFASAFVVIITSLSYSALRPVVTSSPSADNGRSASNMQEFSESHLSMRSGSDPQAESKQDTGITVPVDKLNSPISINGQGSTAAAKTEQQGSVVPIAAKRNTTDYTSRPNVPGNSESGNDIFGQGTTTDSEPLSARIGTPSLLGDQQSIGRTFNAGILIASLMLGLLWAVYAYKKQPAYSTASFSPAQPVPQNYSNEINKQKILEVDQKTDGTVVIYFQGKECKVSKPELNSETDRLIQRLLSVGDQDKEIEYDILEDQNIDLNSPLSKIVTRLGFVGTKRDLFFPRTSKNKVVFRKYITKQELLSMDLNLDQLSEEIAN